MAQKNIVAKAADDQVKGAPRAVLEDLFEDFYKHRKQIYLMNFVRGVFFGFGSVLGATILVTILLWLLSALQFIPFVDGIAEAFQKSLENRKN